MTGKLAPGYRGDLLVLDPTEAALYRREDDTLIDSFVFSGNTSTVRDVMVGGRWVVRERHHGAEERIAAAFRRTLDRIAGLMGP
jgi:formimidoylglutamate deiminase